jgi:hypothetical protein
MGAAVHGERKRSQAARLSKTELAVVSDGIFLRLAFRVCKPIFSFSRVQTLSRNSTINYLQD